MRLTPMKLPSLRRLPPHEEQFRSPHAPVRAIDHASEAVPLREVVFHNTRTGQMVAAQPGTHALRALRRSDPLAWEQVHMFHNQHKDETT
jgi:hypothetical protein